MYIRDKIKFRTTWVYTNTAHHSTRKEWKESACCLAVAITVRNWANLSSASLLLWPCNRTQIDGNPLLFKLSFPSPAFSKVRTEKESNFIALGLWEVLKPCPWLVGYGYLLPSWEAVDRQWFDSLEAIFFFQQQPITYDQEWCSQGFSLLKYYSQYLTLASDLQLTCNILF